MISVKEDQLILDESGFKCKIKVSVIKVKLIQCSLVFESFYLLKFFLNWYLEQRFVI